MKDKQQLNQKSKRNVLSFFELRAPSVLKPIDSVQTKPQILGGVIKNV
jgi:hypothetical protein